MGYFFCRNTPKRNKREENDGKKVKDTTEMTHGKEGDIENKLQNYHERIEGEVDNEDVNNTHDEGEIATEYNTQNGEPIAVNKPGNLQHQHQQEKEEVKKIEMINKK